MKKRALEVDPVIKDDRGIKKDRALPILAAAVVFALLVNVVFYLSYPMNMAQSDNPTFLKMIVFGISDLMHTSGYPAVLYFLTHHILPQYPSPGIALDINVAAVNSWYDGLQILQVLLHLSLFLTSIFLCSKVFSKAVATVLALAWGCNVLFISSVNAAAPEWLEGHMLILSLLMHAYARQLTARKKVFVYCLAAGVFGFAYLIKPNALLFAIALIPFLLFDKESWRFKALQLSGSIAIFLLLTMAYANTYHYNSTGTRKLNFDHGWVLTAALPTDYESTSPEQLGLNSLRWAVLARVTPLDYFRAGSIENINYGPTKDLQQQYQEQLNLVFHMSRKQLIQFVSANPLPPGYNQWLSAVPLYYYYGLEEVDAFGASVYMESLRTHTWFHIQKIRNALLLFLGNGVKSDPPVPTFNDPLGLKFLPPDFNASFLGESRIVLPPDINPVFLAYYNPRKTVSYYGLKIFGVLNALNSISHVYFALNVICLLGLFKLKSNTDKIAAFFLLAALGAFISASGILLGVRQKELITITPVYFLFLSIGLIRVSEWWWGNVAARSLVQK